MGLYEKQLGAFLKKRRGEMTYRDFAKKLGLSHSTVQRLELGNQNVTLKTLHQIASRLKCSLGDIFPNQ